MDTRYIIPHFYVWDKSHTLADLKIMKLKFPCLLRFAILSAIVLQACAGSTQTFRIMEKPIIFDDFRQELSIQYLKDRHDIIKTTASIEPKIIVLHWTAIPTLEQSFNAMNPVLLPGVRTNLAGASPLNVSAQFLIDRDGMIFRQLPDTAFARHVIGLNHCAIGIENVGGSNAPLTKKQMDANEELIRYLKKKYPIEFVIGHHEYKSFIGHPLWKETDPDYLTVKSDPGDGFMKKIRERISDLDLKGAGGK